MLQMANNSDPIMSLAIYTGSDGSPTIGTAFSHLAV